MKLKSVNSVVIAAAIAAALGAATQARSFELDNVTARVRAIYIDPAEKSDAISALNVPKDGINVEKKWAPDLDFEYGFTQHFGVELLLTIPQKHEVKATQANGNVVPLGSVTHLPPTLTAKYYFLTDTIRPYVGAGINATWFTKNDLSVGGTGVTKLGADSTSFGPAWQAGIDISLSGAWSLSLDAKKVRISNDVSLNGTKLSSVDVSPWIIGVGVGYRFGH
jgi:outer membrane protein